MNNSITVSQNIDASPEKIWDALSIHHLMVQWFFDNIPDFKAEVGFKTEFVVNSGYRDFTHMWEITEVVPLQKIVYNWRYKEYEGNSYVTFLIEENEGQSKVSVTADGIETFVDDIPEFKPESCRGGWEYFMGRLEEFLKR